MKTKFIALFVLLTAALFAVAGETPAGQIPAGQIIDRIVATVNGHIILQSDWEDAIRYEALCNDRHLDEVTQGERKAALDRLIDQELLREQMHSPEVQHPSEQAIGNRIAEIRKLWPQGETEAGWQKVLSSYGLNEAEIKDRVSAELDLAHLVDAKLRPSVQINSGSIENYYSETLLPSIRKQGAEAPTLDKAAPQIKEVLTQQKMNQLLTAWLQKLRSDGEVQTGQQSELQ